MSEGLDSYQRGAVEAEGLRLRVLAGAGSGKTRVLAGRVTWLLDHGVPAEQIMALTFSKKAAEELTFRCQGRIDTRTIHSLCYRLLQSGLHPGRNIADERTRRRLVRSVMIMLKPGYKFAELLAAIQTWKGNGCVTDTPLQYRAGIVAYEGMLHDAKLWDFDDLINVAIRKLREHPDKRAKFQGKWSHILIDEVQDTDARQWQLFELLVTPETSLFLVGDISQSVYSFRGAKPMMLFGEVEQKLGPFTEYRLPKNYRSRPDVIHVANRVVAGKQGAVHLEPTKEPGVDVLCINAMGPTLETTIVSEWVKEIGSPWSDIAILARTNAKLADYEAVLGAAGIPYGVTGGYSFYERSEIQDVLAYLSAAQMLDDGMPDVDALERIYSKPTRYLGKAWLQEVHNQGGWIAWRDARGQLAWSKPYMAQKSDRFYRALEGVLACANAREACEYVIDGPIGYRAWARGEELDVVDEMRDENLNSLIEQAAGKTVLDLQALASECRQRLHHDQGFEIRDKVTLSTVHKAKGLEWPSVAVIGIDDGVWPHKNAEDVEEERRILYVALTRAEERLLVSSRVPSEFYREVVRHAQDAGVSVSWRGTGPQSAGGSGREPADHPDHAPA